MTKGVVHETKWMTEYKGSEPPHEKRRESLTEPLWCSTNSMPSRPIPMLSDKPWQIVAIDLCGSFPLA